MRIEFTPFCTSSCFPECSHKPLIAHGRDYVPCLPAQCKASTLCGCCLLVNETHGCRSARNAKAAGQLPDARLDQLAAFQRGVLSCVRTAFYPCAIVTPNCIVWLTTRARV